MPSMSLVLIDCGEHSDVDSDVGLCQLCLMIELRLTLDLLFLGETHRL